MKIGNIEIKNNVCLAPMAGVTDLPFRLLCREQGCGLVYTEMVSAKAILYNNRNTSELLRVRPGENPIAVQLFGSDPEIMADMAKRVEELPFDIIDVNMGCPVPKVVNNGEGSALMKNPVLVGKIVEAMANAVDKPVTVKIRKGFDEAHVNAPEIARIIQESGGACVAVHGRTREQYYSGEADWDVIRSVKENVTIPVIGNGDIRSADDASRMMRKTGCDGVMIGRAARGNPWIFSKIKCAESRRSEKARPTVESRRSEEAHTTGESYDSDEVNLSEGGRPSSAAVREMIMRHANLLVEYKGEFTGIREMRKHFAWYTAGFPDSASLRNRVNYVESLSELEGLVLSIV